MNSKSLLSGAAAALAALAFISISVQAAAQQPAENQTAAPLETKCSVVPDLVRLDLPLSRVGFRVAAGLPMRIVAIGSSSTAGAGATSRAASYPSRLQAELRLHFPGDEITVVNRGVNGEEAPNMLARFDAGVIAEHPHLVLWQLGTNSLLRDRPLDPAEPIIHKGIARLKAAHTDIVLIDPQFAPRVIAKNNVEPEVALLASVARQENVDFFDRFALMRYWHDVKGIPFETFVSPDGLHMNDWSYACFAKWLGVAIADAANRPAGAVAAPRTTR
ncbi:MAG TPA: SGNH/GDSL hydrolase family protein [Xanthobacteraceae bacterium]|jgi:lysophospholipase L1-like esterase